VFGRRTQRTQLVDGRARKTIGPCKPMHAWNVLIRDHHVGYVSCDDLEENRRTLSEMLTCSSALAGRLPAVGGFYLPVRYVADLVAESCMSSIA
jgi:hypothetical protein